tara:strand:- start:1236 stop:1379 length:144 start_codon:yes stop_codon:yes gene_type:complete
MKLILITKEDWGNASLGVRLFNVILDVVSLLGIGVATLEFLDWIGVL